MHRIVASVALAAALLLAGCGDDGSSEPTVVGSPGSTAAAPETTERSPGTTARTETTATTTGGDVRSEAELEALLLTAADLPAGWRAEPASDDDDDDDGDAPECFQAITREVGEGDAPSVEADFTRGDLPVLFQKVGDLGDEAAERFEIVTTGLARCTDLELPGEGGQPIVGTISPLPFPALGDESAAYRMAFDYQGAPLTFDVSLARVDGVVVILLFGDLGGANTADFAPIAEAAVAKVQAGLA